MFWPSLELEPRSCCHFNDGAGHENLSSVGAASDSVGRVDRDPEYVGGSDLDFAGLAEAAPGHLAHVGSLAIDVLSPHLLEIGACAARVPPTVGGRPPIDPGAEGRRGSRPGRTATRSSWREEPPGWVHSCMPQPRPRRSTSHDLA